MIESDLDSDLGPPSQGSEMEVLSPHLVDRLDQLSDAPPPPPLDQGGGVRVWLVVGLGVGALGVVLALLAIVAGVMAFLVAA